MAELPGPDEPKQDATMVQPGKQELSMAGGAVHDPAEYKDSSKRIKLFSSGTEFTHIDGNNPEGLNKDLNKLIVKFVQINS